MTMDPAAVQRVRSHIARIAPSFDHVVSVFFRRFARQSSFGRQLAAPSSKQARFELAEAVSAVTKNLDHLDSANWVFERMSAVFNNAGVAPSDMLALRSSLLGAIAECSGAQWDRQLDADFSSVIGAVFSRVKLAVQAAPQVVPFRKAA